MVSQRNKLSIRQASFTLNMITSAENNLRMFSRACRESPGAALFRKRTARIYF